MLCRHCGTEIADKAIICYRCGASTTDPVRQAVPLKKRRPNPILSFVTVVILLVLALYMGQASRTAADPGRLQTIAGVLVAAAILVLIIRIVRRR